MNKYLTLVNKEHKIKDNYLKNIKLVPIKLYDKTPSEVEEKTYEFYQLLKQELKEEQIEVALDSAYRSIETQQLLKEEFINKYGPEYTKSYVAEPKTSEHHTGLALDLTLKIKNHYIDNNDELIRQDKIFKKIHKLLPKYGFILRFPKGKESLTGHPYEPWHIRYVGKIPAQIMAKEDLCLEEYLTTYSTVLYINKEEKKTSFDIVKELSEILGIKKIGHTGTLDPLATGVLVVTVGEACKIAELLTAEDKEYIAGVLLGVKTDTLDITGNVIASKPVDLEKDIEKVVSSYQKTYLQTVPIYSAVKVKGKKLYEYARSNKEVELPKKEVTIKKIKVLTTDNDTFMIKALVSKGCYIRSLINDIGESLDTYATMTTLERTKQGKVKITETNTMDEIRQGNIHFHNIEEVLDYPVIKVEEPLARKIKNGMKLKNTYQVKDKVIFKTKDKLLGIYQKDGDILKVWKNFR